MWKADFGAIDSTIAGRFNDGKERRKFRVEYYTVDDVLARNYKDKPNQCVAHVP